MLSSHSTLEACLHGVERVLTTKRAGADELADEPQFEIDAYEKHQAYDDENRHRKMILRGVQ